jgi:hypothetical protein
MTKIEQWHRRHAVALAAQGGAMTELTPQHVLVDPFDSDDWPDSIPEPETAAEIVVQRLIDAGFAIEAQERARS